jgi:hypothetical protein
VASSKTRPDASWSPGASGVDEGFVTDDTCPAVATERAPSPNTTWIARDIVAKDFEARARNGCCLLASTYGTDGPDLRRRADGGGRGTEGRSGPTRAVLLGEFSHAGDGFDTSHAPASLVMGGSLLPL